MKGIHKVVVGTKYLKYEFELRRNLTIIRGDSATGKTTLVDMIRTHMNDGESGPVTLNCGKGCYVVEGNLWKGQLDNIQDSIVFIDEGNEFVKTKDFARAIQQTDNYYVIVTREGLPALPYSVEEVYGIRTSGKYGSLKQSYHSFYRIYPDSTTENIKLEKILTEDSNSGYQFFDAVCAEHQMQCDTANGKSYAWCAADPKFEGRSKTTLKRDAASMIEEYYTKGEKIKRLEGLLECIGRAPKLEDKIAELREEKALAERKAKKYSNSASPWCFQDLLFKELEQKLRKTLDEKKCSMLPEDLLQYQVEAIAKGENSSS